MFDLCRVYCSTDAIFTTSSLNFSPHQRIYTASPTAYFLVNIGESEIQVSVNRTLTTVRP